MSLIDNPDPDFAIVTPCLIASGEMTTEGNPQALAALAGLLDSLDFWFTIVEPLGSLTGRGRHPAQLPARRVNPSRWRVQAHHGAGVRPGRCGACSPALRGRGKQVTGIRGGASR